VNLELSGHIKTANMDHPQFPMIKYCLDSRAKDGVVCEFGVWRGDSANYIADIITPERLYAFDSFKGLGVKWKQYPENYFEINPDSVILCNNIALYKGYFKDTIGKFIEENPEITKASFINIDCDLYESTVDVLFGMQKIIVPGTILYFDEMYVEGGYGGEHQALMEYCDAFGVGFSPLLYNDAGGVAIEVDWIDSRYVVPK
jgi:hypothetical protein